MGLGSVTAIGMQHGNARRWKIVHRHGDAPPIDQSLPGEAATA
jgi:hypothetical protein